MLDPLFTLSSQNQRLTENTQRSSDAVRNQALKEGKEKGRRGSIDSSQISSDMNEMGEDLMGSMDPDLFGKGGSASLFKKMWEETVEGEEEEEPEGDGSGTRGDGRDESGSEPVLLELPAPEEAPAPEGAPAPSGERLEVPLPTSPLPQAAPRKEAEEPRSPAPARRESREKRETPGAREAEVRAAAEAAPALSLGGGSLLDFSEGFLLHESTVAFEAPEEAAPALEAAPLSAELEAVLAAMLQGDSRSPAWIRLQRLLGRFGAGVLGMCAAQKVRVCLLPRGSGVRSHPAVRNAIGAGRACGGAYLPESRTCLVEEESLLAAPRGFHPGLYYVAQAWDHALGGEDFASVQSAAVKASYDACRRGIPGHAFPDGMAAESPAHYFAQAVEAYLSENDCVDPLWSREDLYDFDRSMYSYVEYLLKQGNRGR